MAADRERPAARISDDENVPARRLVRIEVGFWAHHLDKQLVDFHATCARDGLELGKLLAINLRTMR